MAVTARTGEGIKKDIVDDELCWNGRIDASDIRGVPLSCKGR